MYDKTRMEILSLVRSYAADDYTSDEFATSLKSLIERHKATYRWVEMDEEEDGASGRLEIFDAGGSLIAEFIDQSGDVDCDD